MLGHKKSSQVLEDDMKLQIKIRGTMKVEIEDDTNKKISYIHGLKELILRCSLYPKSFIDGM